MLTSVRSVSSGGYVSILANFPPLSLKDWSLPGQFLYNKFYVPAFVQRRKNAKEKKIFQVEPEQFTLPVRLKFRAHYFKHISELWLGRVGARGPS